MIVCISFFPCGGREKEIEESTGCAHRSMNAPPARSMRIRSPSSKTKKQAVGLLFVLVDSKGIEPSNLTDANRALSQLSYEPIFTCLISDSFCIIAHFSKK